MTTVGVLLIVAITTAICGVATFCSASFGESQAGCCSIVMLIISVMLFLLVAGAKLLGE